MNDPVSKELLDRLLALFECPDHGSGCVPLAIEEVKLMRSELASAALRSASLEAEVARLRRNESGPEGGGALRPQRPEWGSYPKEWRAISRAIRERAGGRCECMGECGLHGGKLRPRRCIEIGGQPAKWARGKVVLTVAHLNHMKNDNRPENLRAMCNRCHLRIDVTQHLSNRRRTREERSGQRRLPT